MSERVRCRFYLRTRVYEETFTYRPLDVRGPSGDGKLDLFNPPAVGDLVHLPDHGGFRVVDRAWMYSGYGSSNWPRTEDHSQIGPRLDVIVERADGPFVNEA